MFGVSSCSFVPIPLYIDEGLFAPPPVGHASTPCRSAWTFPPPTGCSRVVHVCARGHRSFRSLSACACCRRQEIHAVSGLLNMLIASSPRYDQRTDHSGHPGVRCSTQCFVPLIYREKIFLARYILDPCRRFLALSRRDAPATYNEPRTCTSLFSNEPDLQVR